VIGAVLKVEGVSLERDRPRRVPAQGGDELGVRCANSASGWFCARAVTRLGWTGIGGECLRLGITVPFAPELEEYRFVGADSDLSIRTGDETMFSQTLVRK
jgi:hypothetical protein